MRRNRRWQVNSFEDWVIFGALVFMVLMILGAVVVWFGFLA
jgi:hypothetical protein